MTAATRIPARPEFGEGATSRTIDVLRSTIHYVEAGSERLHAKGPRSRSGAFVLGLTVPCLEAFRRQGGYTAVSIARVICPGTSSASRLKPSCQSGSVILAKPLNFRFAL